MLDIQKRLKGWKATAILFLIITLFFIFISIVNINVAHTFHNEMLEHGCNADCIGELYQYSKMDFDNGRCVCFNPVEEFGEIDHYNCLKNPFVYVPYIIEIYGGDNIFDISNETNIFPDDIILNPAFIGGGN